MKIAVAWALLASSALAAAPSFEKEIAPLLLERCGACHSTGKRKHGLDVRQRRTLVRGGDTGPAVVPGDIAKSLLWKRVSAGEMPPGDRPKLSGAQLELVKAWIEAGALVDREEKAIEASDEEFLSPEDREHWSFKPLVRPAVPQVGDAGRIRTPLDAFVLEKLASRGFAMAPDAPLPVHLRRASFALLGLPPTIEELDALASDQTPLAWERSVDRLLASPRFGERWARHWLDAAGYFDSDGGGEADPERPHAWKYVDWVVRALNEDLPYDRFLEAQLAGDELAGWPGGELTPERRELLVATGFLRNAPDGTAQGGGKRAQNQVIADTVGIVGSGVLGITLACAQCHDHRYDPISQRDYHRIRAAFEPALNLDAWKPPAARRISLYTDADRAKAAGVAARAGTKREERQKREAELVEAVREREIAKLADGNRELAGGALKTPADQRTAEQKKLLDGNPSLLVSGGTLYQYDAKGADELKALDAGIAKITAETPPEDFVSALWEEPGQAPKSRLLVRGDPDQPAEDVAPGPLSVLSRPGAALELSKLLDAPRTSARRLALAHWLTGEGRALTARVIANRIWMHHFGRGIAATAGDLGTQGDPPTHPALLDWLASEIVEGGWRLKRVHRLILTSTVWRQSSSGDPRVRERDPDGDLLSRQRVVRLEGEAIRDAMLFLSGRINLAVGGPHVPVSEDADGSVVVGVVKKAESNRPGSEVDGGATVLRRTLYVQTRRSAPLSFTAAFDVPATEIHCARRPVTTTAPQALMLLNGRFAREEAQAFAKRLVRDAADPAARIALAFRIAFARTPSESELRDAVAYLAAEPDTQAALTNFCHALFNANEFVFVE